MGKLMTRQFSIGTSAVGGLGTTKQFYEGPCVIEAMSIDFHASADGGTVVTIYDGFSTSGRSIYTQTGATDLGTTVPVVFHGDADLVAGTSTAGVGNGLVCADGVFVAVTLDVTGPQNITLWIRSLVKKTVNLALTGAAGSAAGAAQIWQGAGLWRGYLVGLGSQPGTTLDLVFRDAITDAAPTVMTKTNYATLPLTIRQVVTTTGEDEAGAVVTTAATGSYNNDGIYLRTGLRVVGAQGNAGIVTIAGLFDV